MNTKVENPPGRALLTHLEKHEKRWRERVWRHFSMTRRGCISWADWFNDRRDDALRAQREMK